MRTLFNTYRTTAAIAAVVFAGAAAPTTVNTAPSKQHHVVEIRDLEFSPAEFVVAPGDTITWINHDIVPHSITTDDDSWGSTTLKPGEMWQTTAQSGMKENYFCAHHPSMTARIRLIHP